MKHLRATFALICTLTSALAFPLTAHADARIEGAKLCTQHIPSNERKYGIPSHLLSAISSTESGRYHEGLKIVLPWPWTINAEGKGFYFDSKAEAIAKVKALQAQGVRSIDIGCMQVNLVHHPNAFANIEEAFDPKYNIAYAASFVRSLYEADGNWKSAAAAYHSRTPDRGSKYVGMVFKRWETIISRLRLPARDTIQKASAGFDGKSIAPAPAQAKTVNHTRPAKALPEQRGQALANQSTVRMKVINVSESRPANQGIMIVKPDVAAASVAKAEAPITLARVDATPEVALVDSKIIRMDKVAHQNAVAITSVASNSASSTKNGPRFIFSD